MPPQRFVARRGGTGRSGCLRRPRRSTSGSTRAASSQRATSSGSKRIRRPHRTYGMRRSSTSRRTWRSVTPRCSASFGISSRCGRRLTTSRSRCLQLRCSTPGLRASSTTERDDFFGGTRDPEPPKPDPSRQPHRQSSQDGTDLPGPQCGPGGDPSTRVKPPGRRVEQRCVLVLSEGRSPRGSPPIRPGATVMRGSVTVTRVGRRAVIDTVDGTDQAGDVPTRARHPKKEVEQALRLAEDHGWMVRPTASGHRWGRGDVQPRGA